VLLYFFKQVAAAAPASQPARQCQLVEEWVRVEDPSEPIHLVVEKLFEEPTRAGRRAASRRRRVTVGWGVDVDGCDVFYGKRCCAESARMATLAALRMQPRAWSRNPDALLDALVCGLCDAAVCSCGGVPKRNDALVCRQCMSVFRRTRKLV